MEWGCRGAENRGTCRFGHTTPRARLALVSLGRDSKIVRALVRDELRCSRRTVPTVRYVCRENVPRGPALVLPAVAFSQVIDDNNAHRREEKETVATLSIRIVFDRARPRAAPDTQRNTLRYRVLAPFQLTRDRFHSTKVKGTCYGYPTTVPRRAVRLHLVSWCNVKTKKRKRKNKQTSGTRTATHRNRRPLTFERVWSR